MGRPSWDEYFLEMARVASTRSACFRSHCGAVIAKNNATVSTGYNGNPKYQKNCSEIGFCYRDKNGIKSGTSLELCRAVGCHAETNAISMAAKLGNSTDGATMYIYGNTSVCNQCRGSIANAGIRRVVYNDKDGNIHEYVPSRDWCTHPIDMAGKGYDTPVVRKNDGRLIYKTAQPPDEGGKFIIEYTCEYHPKEIISDKTSDLRGYYCRVCDTEMHSFILNRFCPLCGRNRIYFDHLNGDKTTARCLFCSDFFFLSEATELPPPDAELKQKRAKMVKDKEDEIDELEEEIHSAERQIETIEKGDDDDDDPDG